jgi:glycosyltransferase involved in cell wall biosynthesis
MTDATPRLITVVIPTRGRADLVVRAVQSALSQTYTDMEVIVVVDGPDLATSEALEVLAGPRLRVIALTENVGGSEARNIGVRAARGSWIALLDDDDQWLPEKLERQMVTMTGTNARHCLVTCLRLERRAGHSDILAPRRALRSGEDVSEYMFYSEDKQRHTCGPQTSSYVGTKELFLDIPFSKGLKCHQDWDWYLRAMRNDTTVSAMVDEPLYIMYVEPERPRLTQVANWEYSLEWIESHRDLFTERAYTSFLVNECMYRCEQIGGRTQIFLRLLALCRINARLQPKDLAAAVKWYLFRPSVRLRLKRYYKQLQVKPDGRLSLETPTTKGRYMVE